MSSDQHEPPEHLDAQAAKKWRELLPVLHARGDAGQPGTLDALACYCSAWSRWLLASAEVDRLGLVIKSPQGFAVGNPFLAVAEKAQRQVRQWGAELKITPKSRSARQPADDPAADPFVRILKTRKGA